jgi:hypothetical protein
MCVELQLLAAAGIVREVLSVDPQHMITANIKCHNLGQPAQWAWVYCCYIHVLLLHTGTVGTYMYHVYTHVYQHVKESNGTNMHSTVRPARHPHVYQAAAPSGAPI